MAMPLPPHEPDTSLKHTLDCAACWSYALRHQKAETVRLEIIRSSGTQVRYVTPEYAERYVAAARRRYGDLVLVRRAG